jgi:type II secretory pathway pseudopilin PulG
VVAAADPAAEEAAAVAGSGSRSAIISGRSYKEEKMKLLIMPKVKIIVVLLSFLSVVVTARSFGATAQQKSFASAEEAVKAAIAAARANNDKDLLAIFGASAKDLLSSGDPVADKQRREAFIKAYDEKNQLMANGSNMIVVIGKNEWPFPIPLVKKNDAWVFDTAKGRDEILNRRIGDNELSAIQVSLAYFDAQREYAQKDRNGDGVLKYAQKFRSDPGKKNGLYWEAKTGEEVSPLGPFAVRAAKQGYTPSATAEKPAPYHGYYYRILSAQGKDAPGGAYSYVVKGKMIGGFALVAYPAEYGNSGVMTFILNHDGKVFQKDLGKNTASVATTMKEYNPDKTWAEVKP